jgi:hypothetical protein
MLVTKQSRQLQPHLHQLMRTLTSVRSDQVNLSMAVDEAGWPVLAETVP